MEWSKLTEDLAIHQKLCDEPNDVGGLSAQALKEKFDQAGLTIQRYLNETHLPQLREALEEQTRATRDYVDKRVVAMGAGDMAAALYDKEGRRTDIYEYAHDEATRVLGAAARFGWVAMGKATGIIREGTAPVELDSPADPRGLWRPTEGCFLMPPGAQAFGVTLAVQWAREHLCNCGVRLEVNGEKVDEMTGPSDVTGQYSKQVGMLTAAVRGGDKVRLVLFAKGYQSYQAEVSAQYLRAEVIM